MSREERWILYPYAHGAYAYFDSLDSITTESEAMIDCQAWSDFSDLVPSKLARKRKETTISINPRLERK